MDIGTLGILFSALVALPVGLYLIVVGVMMLVGR